MPSSCFLPRSMMLAIGSVGNSIIIYNVDTFEVTGTIPEIATVPTDMEAWIYEPEQVHMALDLS